MQKTYVHYDTIHAWSMDLAQQVAAGEFEPQVIVALSRGGLVPGVVISHALNLPLIPFRVSLRDHAHLTNDTADWFASYVLQNKGVLVVDDINDSGDTIRWMTRHLQERLPWSSHTQYNLHDHVRFAVLLNKDTSAVQADFWAQSVSESDQHIWWEFPWEKTT